MKTKKEIEKMIDELCQLDQAIQDGIKTTGLAGGLY